MVGRRIRIFKMFGFSVHIDASWIFIAVLITWSLAAGYFPVRLEGLSPAVYWVMGITGALGLFLSVIFHEMAHSLVARRHGMEIKGITLFVFGGMAEMGEESQSPKSEFLMAIAGPLSSLFLAGAFFGVLRGGGYLGWPAPILGVIGYLSFLNVLLAGFNMVPAFPLDGGRVLRSALWAWKKNLRWATRVAAGLGSAFGLLLVTLGLISVFQGIMVGGVWWILIGLFLRGAAQQSYQQLEVQAALEGEKVAGLMDRHPVAANEDETVEHVVAELFRQHQRMLPVVGRDNRLVGCVSTKEIRTVPRALWHDKRIAELAVQCSLDNAIPADEEAYHALQKMHAAGSTRLMVTEDNRLIGTVALKELLEFVALKKELEADAAPSR